MKASHLRVSGRMKTNTDCRTTILNMKLRHAASVAWTLFGSLRLIIAIITPSPKRSGRSNVPTKAVYCSHIINNLTINELNCWWEKNRRLIPVHLSRVARLAITISLVPRSPLHAGIELNANPKRSRCSLFITFGQSWIYCRNDVIVTSTARPLADLHVICVSDWSLRRMNTEQSQVAKVNTSIVTAESNSFQNNKTRWNTIVHYSGIYVVRLVVVQQTSTPLRLTWDSLKA